MGRDRVYMYFFKFSDGKKLYIEADNVLEAMKSVEEKWYKGIFDKCDFEVMHVTGASY